jgi:hypothetical protein
MGTDIETRAGVDQKSLLRFVRKDAAKSSEYILKSGEKIRLVQNTRRKDHGAG